MGECVSDDVVLARYVLNIRCKLGNVIQVVKLPWRTFVFLLLEGEGSWLMVHQDGEMMSFQHVAEVSHSLIDRQELPVISAVFLLRRTELSGEEGEGLPAHASD